MAENYPEPPKTGKPVGDNTYEAKIEVKKTDSMLGSEFPDQHSRDRVQQYEHFQRLFEGDHFNAFNIKIDDERWNKAYSKLRYVQANFAGLISKIVADMLFSEPIVIKDPDGTNQKWIEGFVKENQLNIQFYESALSNSALGDALFKLRVGKRMEKDASTVIAEDISPSLYFPVVDAFNVRSEPVKKILAWKFKFGEHEYLRQEIHVPGRIENKVYKMEKDKVIIEVPFKTVGLDLPEFWDTKIDRHLLFHIRNWKTNNRHFGLSDYLDLESIFYAINNRMTMIDNILDKHSDPILMVPPGIMDENGKVKKKALGVIEMGEGEDGKPEYVVWDASLENAFKEVEKLVEHMYLTAEIAPDLLGLGKGMSDSGRALKFKMLRTIAKTARKKLYYDQAIKEMFFTAMMLAKKHNVKVDGVAFKGEPFYPEIEWKDGLPVDEIEQTEVETKRVDAGLTSKKAAIMRIFEVDEEAAEAMVEEERKENEVDMPKMDLANIKPQPKPNEDEDE